MLSINRFKAETFLSVLLVISLFSIFFISYHQWQQQQIYRQNQLYQKKQAMQIAESQIALKIAGIDCESQIIQNEITFKIQCSGNEIQITYPLGKFILKKTE